MPYLPLVARRLTYLILAVGGFAALFLVWSAWRNSRTLSDAEMLKRLPSADAVVLSIDFSQLRHSGLFEKLTGSKRLEEADYQAFVRDSGFDYKRDLDRVLASFTTSGTLFVVRGHFDWARLQSYAKQSGGDCYNDLCHMPGSQPDRRISFLPLAKDVMGLAVTATDSAASQLLQPAASQRSIGVPTQPVWISMPGSALLRSAKGVPGGNLLASSLASVDEMMLTVGAQGSNFAARMEAHCRSSQDAATLNAQLKTLTSFLQAAIAREKKKAETGNLTGVLTAGQFRQSNRTVYGEWTLEKSFFDNLAGM
jgi:hypothetical protein